MPLNHDGSTARLLVETDGQQNMKVKPETSGPHLEMGTNYGRRISRDP